MKKQILKYLGFLFLSQLLMGIAGCLVLVLSSGSKVLAAYMCSALCGVYGVVVLKWHKKKHTDTWFWRAVRKLAILVLIGAVVCFLVAPFPDLYSVRGMTSAAVIVPLK